MLERSPKVGPDVNGESWFPICKAARTLSVTMAQSAHGPANDNHLFRIWQLVREETIAFNIISAPPSDERIAGLKPFSEKWFDACAGNPQVWGTVGADYGNFYFALATWLKSDGISVSRRDLYRHIRDLHVCNDDDLSDAIAATTWNFPQALAWIATRDLQVVETIRWAFAAFGPKTAVYQSEEVLAGWHSEWIGWLVIQTAERHCSCGCKPNESQERWEVCRCVGNAWTELIGLSELADIELPRFDAKPSTGSFSMTWPAEAERTWLPVLRVKDRWQQFEKRLPPDDPFVTLSEALTWIAFNFSMDSDALHEIIEADNFRGKVPQEALKDAVARFTSLGTNEKIALRGKYRAGRSESARTALTAEIEPIKLADYRQFNYLHDELLHGSGLTWWRSERGIVDRLVGDGRKDGYVGVTVNRNDLMREFPADNCGKPKNATKGRKRPGPAPDPDWPHAIAKVTEDCVAAGYKRLRKRGDKAAIQTMLLNFMADKDKHYSDDAAAKHAETVIASLPDN